MTGRHIGRLPEPTSRFNPTQPVHPLVLGDAYRRSAFSHDMSICGTQRLARQSGSKSSGLEMVKSMALETRECKRKIDSVHLASASDSKLARLCERTADRTGVGSDPAECKTRMPLGRARLHIENHREVGAKEYYSTARNTQKRFLTPFCCPKVSYSGM